MILTPRLLLRGYRDSDLSAILKAWNDPSVFPDMTAEYPVPTREKQINAIVENVTLVLIAETRSEQVDAGEFVGLVTIHCANPKNRDGAYGIMVEPSKQGKGYGTEITRKMIEYSFEWMNLHRLELTVYAWNEKAIGLYKKLGFEEEGRQRKKNWYRGEWHDSILMAILEDDWSKEKA